MEKLTQLTAPDSHPVSTPPAGAEVTQAPGPSEEDVAKLITKHRAEIDYVLAMTSANQQQEVAKLGIDPAALTLHYQPLEERSRRLQRDDEATHGKMTAMGTAFMATAAVMSFKFKNAFSGSTLVQATFVALSSLTAGFVGSYAGAHIFGARVRSESKDLATEARKSLEQEVAIALENRVIDAAQKGLPAPVAPTIDNCLELAAAHDAAGQISGTPAAELPKIMPRNASFAHQALAEQEAAHAAGQQR